MKNTYAYLLIISLLLPIFSACRTDAPIGKETDPSADKTISDTASVETEAHVIPDFYLMENGESDYVIVRGENASPSEVTASTELQSYIKQISGTELPIVLDTEAPAAHEIVVGKTTRETEGQFDRETLGDDGFVIDITEDTVWLVGGELRGTLYSVYTFLEEHLGCGFYTKDFEVIPQKKDIGLVLGSDTQIPVFLERDIDWDDISDLSYAVKLKVNGGRSIRYNETEELGGTVHVGAGHVLQRITGTSEDEEGLEPCLLKESTYEAVRNYVMDSLPQNPDDFVVINLGHGDVGPAAVCSCEDCRASINLYGYSGHYLNFYNRIASEIGDTYPNTLIAIFAYTLSVMPPLGGIVPADNIVIQMCPIEFCHSHPLSECATKEAYLQVPVNTIFAEILTAWGDICDKLAIYDYTADFLCYNTILPNFDAQWHNMRLYADSNVKYMYTQGNIYDTNGEFSELRAYLLARLMWDPYMSQEQYYAYMDDFLKAYYGPGWENIRAFIDLSMKNCADCVGTYFNPLTLFPIDPDATSAAINELKIPEFTPEQLRDYKNIDWMGLFEELNAIQLFPNETVIKGYQYFNAAMEAAETEEQRAHIDKSSIQLDVICSFAMQKLDPVSNTLSRLFQKALAPHIANGSISEDEATALKFGFMDITDAAYANWKNLRWEYNKALAEKMLKYGISDIAPYPASTITQVPFEELDFNGLPLAVGHGSWLD